MPLCSPSFDPRPDLGRFQNDTLSDEIKQVSVWNAGRLWWQSGSVYPSPLAVRFLTIPTRTKVLEIKRQWLYVNAAAVVVRVTDDEWARLVAAYPHALQNADEKQSLEFYADDEPSAQATN